jgi:hypothetical protein
MRVQRATGRSENEQATVSVNGPAGSVNVVFYNVSFGDFNKRQLSSSVRY